MTTIHERVLLVSFHCSRWGNRKRETEESRLIEGKHGSDHGVFSVSKSLMASSALKEINAAYNRAKQTHNLLTSPWDLNGQGIITTRGYTEYTRLMQENKMTFDGAAHTFCYENLDDLIKAEESRQGDSFNIDDYPTADEIFECFDFKVNVDELSRGDDIRVDVSDAERKAIANNINQRNDERIEAAVKTIFKRIAEVTEKMHEKLSEYKKKDSGGKGSGFHDSLVSNVLELANILPELNITNDPKITELHTQLTKDLCQNSAIMLKNRDDLRSDTARKAKKIYDKVSSYM